MGIVDTLCRDGIAPLTRLLPSQVEEIVSFLADAETFNAHVWAKATEPSVPLRRALAENRWPAMSHRMEVAIALPHLFELALETRAVAEAYFGESPLLYSMNAFWTQPAPGRPQYQDTHGWHRDGDDRKQLVLFVTGTDTAPGNGAHRYQRGTHRTGDADLGRDPCDARDVMIVDGPAGTAFLADTSGLHVGDRPSLGPRLLLWARWGVSDPPISYGWDKLSPVPRAVLGERYPEDRMLRDAVRLVVA